MIGKRISLALSLTGILSPLCHSFENTKVLPASIRSLQLRTLTTIIEKKTFCEFNSSIKLKSWYSGFKEGAEYDFNCSNTFNSLAQNVGVHMTNVLKNAYTPNNHWGYDWMGNSSSPTTDGRSYYHNVSSKQFRIRTLCDGKIIETIIRE